MVCQANAGTQHDFGRDPILTVVRDGWVVADDTTLGADNGIGVALALAALEEPGLIHPPLEVLLTVNEESGMDGARGLAPGTLHGKTLINLDTEEWGHFYLGCAGGVDVEVRHDCEQEAVPPDYALVQFEVSGLRGGHSGIDIHLGRGNAIKLLAEALRDLSAHTDVRLIVMKGGTARNAIPREACRRMRAACCDCSEYRRVDQASASGMAVDGSRRSMPMCHSCAGITTRHRIYPFRAPDRITCWLSSTLRSTVSRASARISPA